jgi:hypothetical protein
MGRIGSQSEAGDWGRILKRLNGMDAIAPAMETTKRQLFSPVRWERWARLAVVCFLSGELSGGGWGGGYFPRSHGGSRHFWGFLSFDHPLPRWPLEALPWILLIVGAAGLTLLLFLYVSSVFRFILFEAVLHDRCRLGDGWRRWQAQGQSYFLWIIGYTFATVAVIGVVIGTPVVLAWRAGIFREPGHHIGLLVGGGALLLGVFLALLVLSVLGSLFAKDFVVPVMALENVGILGGWRRVLPMLGVEKGAYALYVLMKMILAIGAAMVVAVVDVLVLLAILIPVAIAAVAVFLLAKGLGAAWTPWTVGLTILAGVALLLGVAFILCLVSSPPMVFFQAYALHFFGSRYAPLGDQLAAQTPPAPPPPLPTSASPEPAA